MQKEINNKSVLITDNLSHVYAPKSPFEFKALKDVSVEFEPNKYYAIIGKTGSGKSTLVQHLNALLKPTSGYVSINGKRIDANTKKIKDVKEIRKMVGLVFQFPEYQLFETSVLKDVMFGPTRLGQTKEEAEVSAKKALKAVKISEDLWTRSPFELSGGQKRRVAIAGILAINTDVIVFDEPTAGLDPKGEEDINELIQGLKKQGKCVIVVTHNLSHVLAHADDVIIMNDATLLKNIEKTELFAKPSILKKMELAIPTQTQIMEKLKSNGFEFKENTNTMSQLISEIKRNLK